MVRIFRDVQQPDKRHPNGAVSAGRHPCPGAHVFRDRNFLFDLLQNMRCDGQYEVDVKRTFNIHLADEEADTQDHFSM